MQSIAAAAAAAATSIGSATFGCRVHGTLDNIGTDTMGDQYFRGGDLFGSPDQGDTSSSTVGTKFISLFEYDQCTAFVS